MLRQAQATVMPIIHQSHETMELATVQMVRQRRVSSQDHSQPLHTVNIADTNFHSLTTMKYRQQYLSQ